MKKSLGFVINALKKYAKYFFRELITDVTKIILRGAKVFPKANMGGHPIKFLSKKIIVREKQLILFHNNEDSF